MIEVQPEQISRTSTRFANGKPQYDSRVKMCLTAHWKCGISSKTSFCWPTLKTLLLFWHQFVVTAFFRERKTFQISTFQTVVTSKQADLNIFCSYSTVSTGVMSITLSSLLALNHPGYYLPPYLPHFFLLRLSHLSLESWSLWVCSRLWLLQIHYIR